jgi:hypothetical protein
MIFDCAYQLCRRSGGVTEKDNTHKGCRYLKMKNDFFIMRSYYIDKVSLVDYHSRLRLRRLRYDKWY